MEQNEKRGRNWMRSVYRVKELYFLIVVIVYQETNILLIKKNFLYFFAFFTLWLLAIKTPNTKKTI